MPAATLRRVLNAGRRNLKDRLEARLHFYGSGKRDPGKSEGLFPGRCAQRTKAGRVLAGISQDVKPCIKSTNRGGNSPFVVRPGFSTIAAQKWESCADSRAGDGGAPRLARVLQNRPKRNSPPQTAESPRADLTKQPQKRDWREVF